MCIPLSLGALFWWHVMGTDLDNVKSVQFNDNKCRRRSHWCRQCQKCTVQWQQVQTEKSLVSTPQMLPTFRSRTGRFQIIAKSYRRISKTGGSAIIHIRAISVQMPCAVFPCMLMFQLWSWTDEMERKCIKYSHCICLQSDQRTT